MFKKILTQFLTIVFVVSMINIPKVNAAPLQGTRLDTRNYTKIELFNQDIDKLNDGKYDNGPFILKAIGSEPNFTIDDTYNIDIYANGYEAKVQSIDFACDAGLLPNQAITKIAVVGYDYETNDWLKNEQEYTLDYSITEGSVKRAIVNLTTPIVSDRIRVKIKAANVTWGTIRIEELAAYGELTGNKITANIVPEATVTTDIEFVAGDVNVIKDGDFASEARSEKLPSIEAPKTVTYDFGEKYYNFSTMEVVGLFAKDAGIKAMDIEYKKLGEWTKLGETINFARPNGTGTTNMEIDEIPIGIVSNGIRIKIKEAYSGWGHFRFSDILLYGKAAEKPVDPTMQILSPSTMQIFQRDADNKGLVKINGTVAGDITSVIATLTDINQTVISTKTILINSDKTFDDSVKIDAGGWYSLKVDAMSDGLNVCTRTVDKVGVGDIFITAGQSNSANFSQTKMTPTDDIIVAYNPNTKKWGVAKDPQPIIDDGTDKIDLYYRTLGSTWPAMTSELFKHTQVPIGLYSCGRGSSTIEMWQPKYLDDPIENANPDSQNLLYTRLKTAIKNLGQNGFKAILWHQGETEPDSMTAKLYAEKLNKIIETSRLDAKFEVPWLIAEASYGATVSEAKVDEIAKGQKLVVNNANNIFAGANTNVFREGYRIDDWHFNEAGQNAAGRAWAKSILTAFNIPEAEPILPVPPQKNPKKLPALYFTTMPLENNYNDMSRLNNAGPANDPVVTTVNKNIDLGRDYYFELDFKGKMKKLDYIRFETFAGTLGQQNITKVDVDYYDSSDGTWKNDVTNEVIEWNKVNEAAESAFGIVKVPNKIETNRIRIYIKDAKRSYDNFRVDELVVFGFDSEKASNNIAKKANIVVEYPCTEENVNGLLNDENYDTIVSSSTENVPSKYKPAIISLDFGKDSYYKMSDLEFITKEVNKFGVSELDIEYRELGQWKTFKTIQFTHNGMHSSENYAIDKINMEDISTNGIRIKITSALLTDQHFNINEIICHGVIDENAKIANNINGEIIANDGYENLFDENDETIWKSSFTEVPTLQNPEMITFKFKREFTPKVIEFKCPQPDKKITSVQIGYYEGTTLHEIKGETTLLWENDVATVVIDADQTMNNLVVCITGANGTGYSVSGINVLAFDQYSRVVKSISEFEKTKKYSAYEIALNLVNAINDDIIKQEFLNKLTIILEKVKNEQFINASYDVFKKELSINGKLFEKSQYNANISILNGTTYEKIVQTKIDENGLFSTKVPMDDVTVFGEYIIKTVIQGKPISTNVVVREPSSQNDFITFSIDGCKGSISGNNIYVELPHGSSLTKRTPLFKISEYAKVYYGENEIENGKTKIDFTTSTEIKVIAENHDVKIYNIKVTIANGNNGGGGGSGGGSSNSNGNRNENGNVIFPPSIENTNKTFTDVSNEHWAYSYIMELKNDGIVSGVNDTEFKPDDSVKREELAKMLVIMKELPISENNSVFKDVIGNWSMKYVQTIFESGIAKGFSDDIFGVGEDITREDLAVMLYRSLNDEQRNVKITEVERFIDDSEISEYAKTAVYTLRCLGIISGYENVFNPQGTATRAETAKILCGVRR